MAGFLLRDPTSGAVLLGGGGDYVGVYGAPEAAVVPTVAAEFVSPAGVKVSDLAKVRILSATPAEYTLLSVAFGVGSAVTDFVEHVQATLNSQSGYFEGTMPPSMQGQALSALVTIGADRVIRSIIVDSGVTVGAQTSSWPADIPAGSWTATEVRDAAPAGRRKVTVQAAIASTYDPALFEIKLYSGPTDGAMPTEFGATLTPGTDFTTVGSLLTGTTCYNNLAWRRISDGALRLAHPAIEQKSFVIQGLNVTVPPTSDPALSPDVIYSAPGSVRAQVANWIANPSVAPAGKSATDDRVVAVNASTSGDFNLSDLVVPASAGFRVIVRHLGTFSDDGCSVIHTGPVRIQRSRGIYLAMMHLRPPGQAWPSSGTANSALSIELSSFCGASQCIIEARAPALTAPAGLTTSWNGTVVFMSGDNLTLTHNLIRYAGGGMATYGTGAGLTDCLIAGNMYDLAWADDSKFGGVWTNVRHERNWGSRRFQAGVAGDPHEDFTQHQGTKSINCRYWGDVIMNGHEGKGARQAYWHSKHDLTGTSIEQCIAFITANFVAGSATTWSAAPAHHLTLVLAGDPGRGNPSQPKCSAAGADQNACFQNLVGSDIIGYGNRDYNYVTWAGSDGASRSGPNGELRIVGGRSQRNYSTIAADWRYGIPWQDSAGNLIPESQQFIKAWEPAQGRRTHWLHSNPVGAHLRLREIFDAAYRAVAKAAAGYDVFPFAWPVLGQWHKIWNGNSYVADGYTGSWDPISGRPA